MKILYYSASLASMTLYTWQMIACFMLLIHRYESLSHPMQLVGKSLHQSRSRCTILALSLTLHDAIGQLATYDKQYLERMRQSIAENVSVSLLEFRRAQYLKASGIQEERDRLKEACLVVRNHSEQIVLGIMTSTGAQGIDSLRQWVDSLSLPRGMLRAVNDMNEEVDYQRYLNTSVYIKYNSSDAGNAYMKEYLGSFVGVIFQPTLSPTNNSSNTIDRSGFQQYGNLPLKLF
jgi:hypothetical protein